MGVVMDKEKKWIRKIKKRSDGEAANQLVAAYYKDLYGYIYRQTMNRELSMDLTQEVMISMLQSIRSYDEKKASFRTWLYRLATNKLVDYYRSKYYKHDQRTTSMVSENHAVGADFTVQLELKEDVAWVLRELNQLPVDVQAISRLKLFAEYTFSEIADTLDLPESTVKTKYYAMIRTLKKAQKEDDNEGIIQNRLSR